MSSRSSTWNWSLSNHDDGLLERLVKLNILTCTQPVFLNFDIPVINRRVGERGFKYYIPLKQC